MLQGNFLRTLFLTNTNFCRATVGECRSNKKWMEVDHCLIVTVNSTRDILIVISIIEKLPACLWDMSKMYVMQ